MNADNPGEVKKSRPVLGDLSNQLGKRGFSLVSQKPASKSGVGSAINLKNDKNQPFQKPTFSQPENSVDEPSGNHKILRVSNGERLPSLKGGKTYRLHSLGNISDSSTDENLKPGKQSNTSEGLYGAEPVSNEDGEKNQRDGSATPDEGALETLGSQASSNEFRNPNSNCLPFNKEPRLVGSRLTDAQGAKSFELERCVALKGADDASESSSGVDSLKNCSCSYCTKAGYMWSELNYLDTKGRLSALSKHRKDVGNLVRMYSTDNDASRSREMFKKPSLGSELMGQWKSLFLCMEDSLGKEYHQLESNMTLLKEVRENYKMNLGKMNERSSDTHGFPSNPSSLGQNTS